MSAAGKHLILVLPGLAGPVCDHPQTDYPEGRPAALDRLITRAQVAAAPGRDPDSVLLQYFGLDETTPVAPLTYRADCGHAPPGYVMRADPVHLRADQSSLRLFESHSFTISQEEADALVASFNDFYTGYGWHLEAPLPTRWYLQVDAPPSIDTTSPAALAGEDINPALPRGESARAWHAMLNEVQMLFHAHDVNLAREQRGQPVINSLWPWGGGVMPEQASTDICRVLTHDPLSVALAGLTGIDVGALPADVNALQDTLDDGVTLVMQDDLIWPVRYNDVEQWRAALDTLEHTLFAPLARTLAAGRIDSLRLLPCNGRCYTVTRRQLRSFWRRPRPFEQVLA
ncbi:MAG: hypothetical protein WBO34_02435 [Gammaproteobacteria bacterium]